MKFSIRCKMGACLGLILLAACATSSQPNGPINLSDYPGPVSVACVGDSITFGSGITNRTKASYPVQLQALLGDKWEVRNFGVSGATLLKNGNKPYWKQPAFGDVENYNPDVIVIMLGTNDSKLANWGAHKAEFTPDYQAMIDHYREFPSHPRIWLCLPDPVTKASYGISETTLAAGIRPEILRLAKKNGLPVIDTNAALLGHADLFPDGVHPNAEGAGYMARAVAAALTGKPVPVP